LSYDNPMSLLGSYHQLKSLVKSEFNCCFYICNTVEINSLTQVYNEKQSLQTLFMLNFHYILVY
jgi:hypothetical protein